MVACAAAALVCGGNRNHARHQQRTHKGVAEAREVRHSGGTRRGGEGWVRTLARAAVEARTGGESRRPPRHAPTMWRASHTASRHAHATPTPTREISYLTPPHLISPPSRPLPLIDAVSSRQTSPCDAPQNDAPTTLRARPAALECGARVGVDPGGGVRDNARVAHAPHSQSVRPPLSAARLCLLRPAARLALGIRVCWHHTERASHSTIIGCDTLPSSKTG
eukprot:7117438-Prymnesium_polylepis.1